MEAGFYNNLDGGRVECVLCSHRCVINEGKRGNCGVRKNENGVLIAELYGSLIARHVDPIEKKPFYHVLPGSLSYSIATTGCNFHCDFCQNSEISQSRMKGTFASPAEVVEAAKKTGCKSIAYTYTEPTVFMEYALDVAELAHKEGLLNLFVTNGYESPEAISAMKGLIDAANVDLKSFKDDFYRDHCGASLAPVLEAIKSMYEAGIFLEITTLVIPGENDSEEELVEISSFIASVVETIPWHISRFYPSYKLLKSGATPEESLDRALTVGRKAGLKYIYLGNAPGSGFEDTVCPNCNTHVIKRTGYVIKKPLLNGTCCKECGYDLGLLLNLK